MSYTYAEGPAGGASAGMEPAYPRDARFGRAASHQVMTSNRAPGAPGAPAPAVEPWAEEARFMAEDTETEAYATSAGVPLRNMLHASAALTSIALVVWIGIWGYGQVMRDVAGVPVVAALEGPMRIQPETPGGQISEHSGLAVNAVKAGTPEQDLAETVRLAPQPVPLAAEDMPIAAGAPLAASGETDRIAETPVAEEPAPAEQVAGASRAPDAGAGAGPDATAGATLDALTPLSPVDEAQAPAAQGEPTAPATTDSAAIEGAPTGTAISHAEALARALSEGLAPLAAEAARDASAAFGAEIIPANVPGVARSPRPPTRPAQLSRLDAAEASAAFVAAEAGTFDATALSASETPDVAAIVPGTRLVQLGAYDTADEARAAWGEITGRFAPLLDDKGRVVQEAEAGGRAFFRLRARGFADLAEARRFCAALGAAGADCIPVVAR
ncbi:MAG: SPOR domain-containing protein [Pseudomonadota bacterium]